MQPAVVDRAAEVEPPRLLRLAGHPIRWRLLKELVLSDRAVWELTQRLDESQNLVSYHLRQLREGGLVSMRTSSADGRDRYYAIDLSRCSALLQEAGGALHPALWLVPAPELPRRRGRSGGRWHVLFLCTGNSARSQMAEALVEQMSGGMVQAKSAGSNPKPLHSNAVRVMQRRGIDISGNRTKHLDEFVSQHFDFVITLCDRVREVCPEFPSHPRLVHWSIADPAAGANPRANRSAFERTAAELETRIGFFVAALPEPSTRRSSRGQ